MDDNQVGGLATYVDDNITYFEFDGKITSTVPLLTEAQDIAGAINELFMLEPFIKTIIPYKIVYDDINDKIIEYRKVDTEGGTYETISEYELVIENKGSSNEEITKIKLPDGAEIELEGWDI